MMIRLPQFNTPSIFLAVTSYSAIRKHKNPASILFYDTRQSHN
jgi:hypothetical protein